MGNQQQSDISRFMKMLNIFLIALSLDCLGKIIPEAVYWVFAYPAACLAALFFGVGPVIIDRSEILIPLMRHPIHVIPACSAYGFFCLLSALILSYSGRASGVLWGLRIAAAFFAAYLITVGLNAVRIISAYQMHEVSLILLPQNFQAAVHQGVGVVIFLTGLLAVSFYLERNKVHGGCGQ